MMGVMNWLRGSEAQTRGPTPPPDCYDVPVAALFAFADMEDTGVGCGEVLQSQAALAGMEDADIDLAS
jgi:hypothetical protein